MRNDPAHSEVEKHFNFVKSRLDNLLTKTMSRELLIASLKFNHLMKTVLKNEYVNNDFAMDCLHDYRTLSKIIGKVTGEMEIVELLVELENRILRNLQTFTEEKRELPRFQISLTGTLKVGSERGEVLMNDISLSGIQFFSTKDPHHGEKCVLESRDNHLYREVRSVRREIMKFEGDPIFTVGAKFTDPLTWDELKSLIIMSD